MKKCRHANIASLFEVIDDPQQDKIYLGESLVHSSVSYDVLFYNLKISLTLCDLS